MRLRVLLSIAVLIAVLSVSYVPNIVMASLPRVSTVAVTAGTQSEYVNCSGEVIPALRREIYCAAPVYATEVLVCVGDRVEEGQALTLIDVEISTAAAGKGTELESYAEALEQYGISGEQAAALLEGYRGALSTEKTEYQRYDIPTVLKANMSGVITAANISPFVLTDNSKPLFVIEDDRSFGVKLSAGQSDIAKVSVGDEVIVTGAGFGGTYTACITKIYPAARKELSGTSYETVVDMEAKLPEPSDELKSGFSVKCRIIVDEPAEMVLVPYGAIRQDENNTEYVYVYSSGRAFRRDIVTGIELSDAVEAAKGLKTGEYVVLEPDKLKGNSIVLGVLQR